MIFRVSLLLASLAAADAKMRGDNADSEERRARHLMGGMGASNMGSGNGVPLTSVRSFDGSENPLSAPDAELQRLSGPAHYPDGAGEGTSMFTTPNARFISNTVATQPVGTPRSTVTDAFWQWGQFMDHDIGLTEGVQEVFNIVTNEPGDSITSIPFARALSHFTNGVREQLNEITGYLDASMVYGHNEERAAFLREFEGGRMRMQGGDQLLPFGNPASTGLANANGGFAGIDDVLFIGGDIRVNEQPGLLAIHTLWVREHNRIAGILNEQYSDTDENIYQMARKLVTAEIQHITYNEFLPLMIGDFAPNPNDAAFDANVNPGVAQEFAACAFRVGHTFLSGDLLMHNGNAPTGTLNLVDGFFNPQLMVDFPGAIDEILIGQTNQAANSADIFVIDEVRTNLFGAPIAGVGLDLVALNVQRARDHGINKYNAVRAGYGLERKASFTEVSSSPEVVARLTAAYGGNDQEAVDLCDPWICGLAEDAESGVLGEMFSTIIGEQFTRFMNGDAFFYTLDPDVADPSLIGQTGIDVFDVTYADILNANTIGGVTVDAMAFTV